MTSQSIKKYKQFGRLFVFTWFIIGGTLHFIDSEPFVRIMPPYIPFPLACVYISGFFEIIGAISLFIKPVRSLAGIGLMLLTLVVTLANIQMFQHPELFPNIPYWALVVRFPVQVALIWLIWWSSRPDSESEPKLVSKSYPMIRRWAICGGRVVVKLTNRNS